MKAEEKKSDAPPLCVHDNRETLGHILTFGLGFAYLVVVYTRICNF